MPKSRVEFVGVSVSSVIYEYVDLSTNSDQLAKNLLYGWILRGPNNPIKSQYAI